MDHLGGGANGFHYHRLFDPPQSASTSPPVELSEHEIFCSPSGASSPSQSVPSPKQTVSAPNRNVHNGIFAALVDNMQARSGSEFHPVFNHKATASVSSSSSSNSVGPLRMSIPKKQERVRMFHQSAPVNVPVIPAALQRRARELEDIISEDELQEEEEKNRAIVPPHVMVDSRPSRILSCSVLEGAGRTLKGRDLRQVRNAIWQRTGFID